MALELASMLETVPQMAQTIERAGAGEADAVQAYTPSFEDLFDTGDPELLREPIRDWLAANATNRSATFVLQEWLESGGGPEQALTSCHACVSLALDLGP
jgi:hypothetical protein